MASLQTVYNFFAKKYISINSHYGETISPTITVNGITTPAIISGVTAPSVDVLQQVTSTIIQDAQAYQYTAGETAALLAIARVESNLNPYAANTSTSASGVYQFTNGTADTYKLDRSKLFNIESNVDAGMRYLDDAINRANQLSSDQRFDQFTFAEKVYAFHHQGVNATVDNAYLYLTNQLVDKNVLDKNGQPTHTYPDSLKIKLIAADNAASSILSNQTNTDGSITVSLLNSADINNLTTALRTSANTCPSSFLEIKLVNLDPTSTQYALGQTIGYEVIAKDASGNVTYDTTLTPDGYIARQVQYSNGLTATVTQGDITYSATVTTDPFTGAQIFTPIAVQITGVTGTLTPNADGTISVPGNGGDFTVALPTDPLGAITVSAGGQILSIAADSSIQLSGSDLQIQNSGPTGSDTMQIAGNGNFFKMHINPDNSNIVDTYDSSTGVYGQTITDPIGNWKTTNTTYPAAGVTSQTWTASDNSHGDFYGDADGSTTVIYRPNDDSVVYVHNALSHVDTLTNQINGNYFQTSFNAATHEFTYSVNDTQTFSATLSGSNGSDILIGGAGTVTTTINGKVVVFDAVFTGNPSDPANVQLTGVQSVNGSVDATTIDAVNQTIVASGYKLTDVAGGNPDVNNLVVVADKDATAQEQIVKTNINIIPSASFAEWMSLHGAELTMGLNGLGALIKSLDSHSLSDQIHGALWLSTAISNYNNPQSGLSNNLGQVGHIASWLDAVQSLRTGLKSGDGNAIRMAVASMTATVLGELQRSAIARSEYYLNESVKAALNNDLAGVERNASQSVTEGASATALGDAVQAINYAMAADSAEQAFEHGQYLDAVMDLVALIPVYGPVIKAAYDFSKIGEHYADTHNNALSWYLHLTLDGVAKIEELLQGVLQQIFGTPDVWAWGGFANDANGVLHGQVTSSDNGGDNNLHQIHASLMSSLQNVIDQANKTAPVEMGILGSRLMHTRLEVTGGNYFELYGDNYNAGTIFNTNGTQRYDSATSDKFGQNMVEIFVRDAYKNDAILPMWDIKIWKQPTANDEMGRMAA